GNAAGDLGGKTALADACCEGLRLCQNAPSNPSTSPGTAAAKIPRRSDRSLSVKSTELSLAMNASKSLSVMVSTATATPLFDQTVALQARLAQPPSRVKQRAQVPPCWPPLIRHVEGKGGGRGPLLARVASRPLGGVLSAPRGGVV